MKRSNLVILITFIVVFAWPLAIMGVYSFFVPSKMILSINKEFRTIQIDNLSLKAEDVHILSDRKQPSKNNTAFISPFMALDTSMGFGSPHVYYEGEKTYLPKTEMNDSILFVGVSEAGTETRLQLHLRLSATEKVILNGEVIWSNQP
jgi:hypothetical protein